MPQLRFAWYDPPFEDLQMTDNVTNQLLLEHLKAIQANLAAMDGRMNELQADVRGIKSHMAGFMHSEGAQR